MIYLFKVTIIWALFLLLFEVFYKNSGRFSANRFYLLGSILAGLLLPLISLPSATTKIIPSANYIYSTQATLITATVPSNQVPLVETSDFNSGDLWLFAYILGAGLMMLLCLIELIKIVRLANDYPASMIAGYQVIVTGKEHTPYSFMGKVFIGKPDDYTEKELAYVLKHEAAHNDKRHWLDLLFMQLTCIVLWFHPLVWRYRYLLKLQHEYEADAIASNKEAYDYGHFLLQQTLLNKAPAIAHSFHYSPIKNRIKMLTKQTRFTSWKYVIIIPALLSCTLLMAKATSKSERERKGNITTYKGNEFKWRETDTFGYDKVRKKAHVSPPDDRDKNQIVYELNGTPVYRNEFLSAPATFGDSDMAYGNYIEQQFKAQCKNIPDSLATINLLNIVINKEGKVVYYDIRYDNIRPNFRDEAKQMHPFPQFEPEMDRVLEKIINESPNWKPATIDGQPVNSSFFQRAAFFKAVSFSVHVIDQPKANRKFGKERDSTIRVKID